MNSKYDAQVQQANADAGTYAKAMAGCGSSYQRPSALEEMEKNAAHQSEQLQLKSRGIDFLRDNPAFNEFITLIRTGSISI